MTAKLDLNFYKGKTVLVTGHTGFKGSWLTRILVLFGAKVIGYSLTPPTKPALFDILGLEKQIVSIIGDVRDYGHLRETIDKYRPEIVFHLAAQPLVRLSYAQPLYTYDVNVMGTANLLEAIRQTDSVVSVVNVTTDKVYLNNEIPGHAFTEDEPLDGYDPYSNSKSCSELVTHSYKKSFFDPKRLPVSTCRAGNVIGGGDFSLDRIIPDAVRAIEKGEELFVRNPNSTRPYEHVLEPLLVYLLIAQEQARDFAIAGYYNVGPDECDCVTTGELIEKFVSIYGPEAKWKVGDPNGPHEANFLKLDAGKIKRVFGWAPKTHIDDALRLTVEWTKAYLSSWEEARRITDKQIKTFFGI